MSTATIQHKRCVEGRFDNDVYSSRRGEARISRSLCFFMCASVIVGLLLLVPGTLVAQHHGGGGGGHPGGFGGSSYSSFYSGSAHAPSGSFSRGYGTASPAYHNWNGGYYHNWNGGWYGHYYPYHYYPYYYGYWPWFGYSWDPWGYGYYYPNYAYVYPGDNVYDDTSPYIYASPAPVTAAKPVIPATAETPPESGDMQSAMGGEGASDATQYYNEGRAAFTQGDYHNAMRLASHAAVESPRDAKVHELISLSLFALGDYRHAATEAHAAMALGPISNWDNLYAYYGDTEKYTHQLRALEKTVSDVPNSAPGRFLLAYHYLMTGATSHAKAEMAHAVKLTPDDKLAAHYLKQLQSGSTLTPPTMGPPAASPPRAPGQSL